MSTSLETLDFNNSDNSMVALDKPMAPMPAVDKEPRENIYDGQRQNLEKNNIDKEQMMDLSTPLNEVMDMPQEPQQQMMQPQQQMMPAQPEMMAPQPMAQPQQTQQAASQNPGGLTDDQMDALLVAGAAVVAFSPQIKERMMQYAPTMFTDGGSRTLGGTVATGLVAAGLFYGVKKFVLKQ